MVAGGTPAPQYMDIWIITELFTLLAASSFLVNGRWGDYRRESKRCKQQLPTLPPAGVVPLPDERNGSQRRQAGNAPGLSLHGGKGMVSVLTRMVRLFQVHPTSAYIFPGAWPGID